MNTIAVFGHKKPDTDAIVSAIAMSYWLNQQNIPATPYRLDAINHETQFLIDLAHVRTPDLLTLLEQGQEVALVDHNESQQSIYCLNDGCIRYVIDHHKLGDLTTNEPSFIRIQPVGSTATLLFTMFQEKRLAISQQIALLMAGAIISDTLNLTSPTTTETDVTALADLLNIAGIRDSQNFANQLFEAKSNVTQVSDVELLTMDYKQFNFSDKKWGIAVIETVKPDVIFNRIAGLQQARLTVKQKDNLDFLLVIIVDVIKQQSWAIKADDEQDHIIASAFGIGANSNEQLISLGNLVSRKKQFVPAIQRYIEHT